MAGKIIGFGKPPKKGGRAKKHTSHVIYQRLDELGKDIKWLAQAMKVTPRTLYNHIGDRSELKGRNFSRMLQVLGIDLNYYYRVGKYARPGHGQINGPANNKPTQIKNRVGTDIPYPLIYH
jgi:hypothetical protein